MSSDAQIDYETLVQDAMRGVLKAILQRVAKTGLPGEHHFYISFNTRAPGVGLSKRLKERYPEEMTVVLQHRFWDLIVHDDRFEVKLTFDSIPERLVVPFASVKVFVDPSVRFGHQFEDPDALDDAGEHGDQPTTGEALSAASRSASRNGNTIGNGIRVEKKRATTGRKSKADRPRDALREDNGDVPEAASEAAEATPGKRVPAAVAPVATAADNTADAGSKVVSLDKFRKK